MASPDVLPENKTLLRHHQRAELEQEKQQLTAQLGNPSIQDRGMVQQEIRKRDMQLEMGAPPELTEMQRDSLSKEEQTLRKTLSENMLSGEEMRKAPTGAVGKLLNFEKRFKRDVMRWKNLRIALDPENPDPDLSNLESFRPHTRPNDPSMHSAHIRGQEFSFPSESFKSGHDAIDFSAHGGTTPEQRESEEVEALKARLAQIEALLAEVGKPADDKVEEDAPDEEETDIVIETAE